MMNRLIARATVRFVRLVCRRRETFITFDWWGQMTGERGPELTAYDWNSSETEPRIAPSWPPQYWDDPTIGVPRPRPWPLNPAKALIVMPPILDELWWYLPSLDRDADDGLFHAIPYEGEPG